MEKAGAEKREVAGQQAEEITEAVCGAQVHLAESVG